jgi:hypothetical protein
MNRPKFAERQDNLIGIRTDNFVRFHQELMSNKSLLVAPVAMFVALCAEPAQAAPLLDQSAGLKLFLGADVWTAPSSVPSSYANFGFDGTAGGIGYGGAAYYELRLIKLIGVEADLAYQHGSFHRKNTTNGTEIINTITTNSLRLPILAKLSIPLGLGRFWFGLGPEFTLVQSSALKTEQTGGTPVTTDGSTKTRDVKPIFGTAGLGLVIEVPVIGIEIPLEVRASKNLSQPSDFNDRVSFDSANTTLNVRAESSWVFRLGAGIGYQF